MLSQSDKPLPTDTGAAITGGIQPSETHEQETITVTEGGDVETITINGSRPGQTIVVTVGGEIQTTTLGSGYPALTGKYSLVMHGGDS